MSAASDCSNGDSGQMSGRELGEQEDNPDVKKYHKYVMKSKDAMKSDNLYAALHYLKKAYAIYASNKLEMKIKMLEDALKAAVSSEEEDEYINVLGSGLKLYHELHDQLYAHQREGVAWLYRLFKNKGKGGMLADDMGLGKTIQVISFLAGMFDSSLTRSVLLVMPTTLLSNWVCEFEKWAPGICLRVFHGTKSERTRNLQKVQRTQGVVLTSYQLLVNNWQELSTYQRQEFIWDVMILDEGHKIKTSSTKTAKCAHAIPANFRLVLTGTPVQNNLKELWALFDFVCEGSLLGTSKTFKMEYENPITQARKRDATVGEKALGTRMAENLQQLIQPYFLRRTKAEVQLKEHQAKQLQDDKENDPGASNSVERVQIAMPTLMRKNDLIIWVYLSPVQEQIYRDFQNLDHVKELLDSTRSPLAALGVLKKICVHPRLLSEKACTELGLNQAFGRNAQEELESNWFLSSIKHVHTETLIQESGKLTFLVGLLERLRKEGHRTLVFSQSLRMLDIIDHILKAREFKVMRVDGTVTHLSEREKRVQTFQEGSEFNVFLLTTQVGGVGLTLTAANRVVIMDPSWNPATDAQAVDRAYRIGQTNNVVIYRLITCGTVEEKIYRRQIFKDSLIRQTTGDKKNPFRYFSQQELRELFILEDTRASKTQIQLQNLHSAQRKSDTDLDEHIAYLYTLDMFGISDHDLMYSCDETNVEKLEEEGVHYIEQRVRKAQEIVAAESHLNEQFRKQILASTEPPRGLCTDQGTDKDHGRKNKPRTEPEWEAEIGSNETLKEPGHLQKEFEIRSISQDMSDLTLEANADMKISKTGAPFKESAIQIDANASNLVLDESEEEEQEKEKEGNTLNVYSANADESEKEERAEEAHATGDNHNAEIISLMEEDSQSVLKNYENSMALVDISSVASELHLSICSSVSLSPGSENEDNEDDMLVKRTKTRRFLESDDDENDNDIQEAISVYLTSNEKRKSNTSTLSQAMAHRNSLPACEVLATEVSFKSSRRRSVSARLNASLIFASDQFDFMEFDFEDEDDAVMKMQLENNVSKEKNLPPCHQENVMQSPVADTSVEILSHQCDGIVSPLDGSRAEKNYLNTIPNDEACSFKTMRLDKVFLSEKTPNSDSNQGVRVKVSHEKCSLTLVSSLLESENMSPSEILGLQMNRHAPDTSQEHIPNNSFSSSASAFNLVLDESEEEEEGAERQEKEGVEQEEEVECYSSVDVSPVSIAGDVADMSSMMEDSQSVLKSHENSPSHVESDIQIVASKLSSSGHSQASFSSTSMSGDDIVIGKRTKTRRILESEDDDDDIQEDMSVYLTSHTIRQSNTSTPTRAMVQGNAMPACDECVSRAAWCAMCNALTSRQEGPGLDSRLGCLVEFACSPHARTEQSEYKQDCVSNEEAFSIGDCREMNPDNSQTAESNNWQTYNETDKDSELSYDDS